MKYFTFLAAICLLFISCNILDLRRIRGNGSITTRDYNLKNFKSINTGGVIRLYVRQDSSWSVKIETDDNLFEYLQVEKNGDELKVGHRRGVNLNPTNEIKLFVSLPVIRQLQIGGASAVKTDSKFIQNEEMSLELSGATSGEMDVRAPKVKISVSGASTLDISGETKDINTEVSGASTLRAFDLKSENADADASGASTAQIFASMTLKAEASGASHVKYKGDPKLTSNASVASSVKKAD